MEIVGVPLMNITHIKFFQPFLESNWVVSRKHASSLNQQPQQNKCSKIYVWIFSNRFFPSSLPPRVQAGISHLPRITDSYLISQGPVLPLWKGCSEDKPNHILPCLETHDGLPLLSYTGQCSKLATQGPINLAH